MERHRFVIDKVSGPKELLACLQVINHCATRDIEERVLSLEQYAEKLWMHAENYSVHADDQIVGFLSFYANTAGVAFISNIVVIPAYQGMGIGSALLDIVEQYSQKAHFQCIELHVDSINTNAISFYKRKSFRMICMRDALSELWRKDIPAI